MRPKMIGLIFMSYDQHRGNELQSNKAQFYWKPNQFQSWGTDENKWMNELLRTRGFFFLRQIHLTSNTHPIEGRRKKTTLLVGWVSDIHRRSRGYFGLLAAKKMSQRGKFHGCLFRSFFLLLKKKCNLLWLEGEFCRPALFPSTHSFIHSSSHSFIYSVLRLFHLGEQVGHTLAVAAQKMTSVPRAGIV